MNLQHERLLHLCTELRLDGVVANYPAAAQKAAESETSFTDFLEGTSKNHHFSDQPSWVRPCASDRTVIAPPLRK